MTSPRNLGTGTKLAIYGTILAGSFGAAAGIAAAVGPIDPSNGSHNEHQGSTDDDTAAGRPHVPGISIDSDGFRVVPDATSLAADVATTYSFRIVDQSGDIVTDFDVAHERRLT